MIKGSIVELITPTQPGVSPSYTDLERLVEWHIDQGTSALLIGSTLDSSVMLDGEECYELFRRTVWQADGRIVVIADVSASTTKESLAGLRIANDAVVDAVLLTIPVEDIHGHDAILTHFQTVARAARIPVYLREHPERSDLLPYGVIKQLANISGIHGWIERGVNPEAPQALLEMEWPQGFGLYAGADRGAHRLMLKGFRGVVSTLANVAPSQVQALCTACRNGDERQVDALQAVLKPILDALESYPLDITVRWALTEMGLIDEGARPLELPQSSDYAALRRALRGAHLVA
ncbi:MAG: dihydrodipicolinate synthase family protein [Algiphilus sp.]